ncbi:MAG: T9SS type A sorting domain-containing protein [Flavobacteriales bacterium]|nr:T9SS type A sorting domain-containing protein [Flavobacteriales bacterium]
MRRSSASFVRTVVIAGSIGLVLLSIAWADGGPPVAHAYHTSAELAAFRAGGNILTYAENTYFKGSGNCEGCHGHDFQNHSMLDDQGKDVNVVDDWRSTMMANSARDPLWRAKVSHEGLVNPAHQAALEDKCTSCHAPSGRHDKHLTGGGLYSIAELEQDPIGLDGVSCVPCHIQSPDSVGMLFSGNMKFDTLGRPLYGPYDNVFGAPMSAFIGYEPLYSAHILDGGLCASCHTLITETADLSGNLTGGEFVEQATYHEWVNSTFNTDNNPNGISCQGCHVPQIPDSVVISANYLFLEGRSPFGLHHFAGANTFMLKVLRDHISELDLTASEAQFDSTIDRTTRMLQSHSLLLNATTAYRTADTVFVDVELVNLAGHKFPSGYPARRLFVELLAVDPGTGDTLFRSGGFDADNEVLGHDPSYEPHYDVITAPDQAQIYEMVMGDVNGDKTTVLERAAAPLKDNRLLPAGFSTGHFAYDTTLIAGVPTTDMDFGRDGQGDEGSGSDIVHYHVPLGGFVGAVQITARAWYQSVPPKWLEEMFMYSSAPIDSFQTMYTDADGKPLLVKEVQYTDLTVGIDGYMELGVRIFPNPSTTGRIHIEGLGANVLGVRVLDGQGRTVQEPLVRRGQRWLDIQVAPGTYLVVFLTKDRPIVHKVVVL